MTEKLDEFRPGKVQIAGVTRQLTSAGIPYEQIPHDWLEVILAGVNKWVVGREGVEDITTRLGFQIFQGDSKNDYVVTDQNESKALSVKAEDVLFLQGVTVKGRPVSPSQLSIAEKERTQCDDCGILTFCLQDIREQSGRLRCLCNFCITSHESSRIRDQGSRDVCERCTAYSCSHHPSRNTPWG